MDDMAIIYKALGETPLEALEGFRAKKAISPDIPMTYAGRLDPMAEGLLLILLGEKCKEKDQYLGLPKTYEFEILVGFSTDTFDLLGLTTNSAIAEDVVSREKDIEIALKSFIGTNEFPYPVYSSKTHKGEPLFVHARRGESEHLEIPTRDMTVYGASITSEKNLDKSNLILEINSKIDKVSGDFRQREIKSQWLTAIENYPEGKEFLILKGEMSVASGTYIRTIVNELSKKLKIPMVLFSLKRTKIGEFETISK